MGDKKARRGQPPGRRDRPRMVIYPTLVALAVVVAAIRTGWIHVGTGDAAGVVAVPPSFVNFRGQTNEGQPVLLTHGGRIEGLHA